MSKFSNTVEYNLRTTLDSSGITKLQGELAKVQQQLNAMASRRGQSTDDILGLKESIKNLETLQSALTKSFNSTSGILNIKQFQKELNGLSLNQLYNDMSKIGVQGQQTFNNVLGQIGRMDTGFKNMSSTVDKLFNTFGNTVRWGITASIFQRVQNSLYSSVEYVRELDRSLNDIRIVSGQSAEQMRDFSLYANQAAQALGQTTTAFTDAALIFVQQGFDQATSNQLAELTLKTANVTQQDTATVSEQLTSIMNGYQLSVEETANAIDILANVAALGASDLEELATAESRVASTANTMGVSQEQLAAQISTLVSVTRQAPETIGNALRTLYTRLGDLRMGETLEDGVNLGTYAQEVEKVGVEVLDAQGNLRSMGDIIEDLMVKWQDMSSAEQTALATTVAGRYQADRFIALMENAKMYNQQLEIAQDSAGTLEEQQSIYMDSLAAKINQLTAAGEGLISTLFNPDDFKPTIETLTDLINLLTSLINSVGGAGNALSGLGVIAGRVFSNQIGQGLASIIQNNRMNKERADNSKYASSVLADLNQASGGTLDDSSLAYSFIKDNKKNQSRMTLQQQEQYNSLLQKTVELENANISAEQKVNEEKAKLNELQSEYNKKLNKYGLGLSEKGNVTGLGLFDQRQKRNEAALSNLFSLDDMLSRTGYKSKSTRQSALTQWINSIKKSGEESGLTTKQINNLAVSLENLKKVSGADYATGIKELREEVQRLIAQARQVQQQGLDVDDLRTEYTKAETKQQLQIDNARINQESIKGALTSMENNQLAEYTKNINEQIDLQNIVNVISAVGQLAFTWQSFQSLGSLFVNNDLDDGEKLRQILSNLAITFPMLISGLAEIKQGLIDLGFAKQADGVIKFSDALKQTCGGALGTLSAGLTVAKSGVTSLASSFAALMSEIWPLLAIGVAIGGISAVIGGIQQDAENRAQAISDAAETAASNLESLQDAQSNFDSLYQKYKEGTVSSDELATAAETLNSLIDDQSAKAYAAAGNWDAYAAAVANAASQQALVNEDAMLAETKQTSEDFVNAPGWLASGRVHSDNRDFPIESLNTAWNNAESLSLNNLGDYDFAANSSTIERIQDLQNFSDALDAAYEEANTNLKTIKDVNSDAYKEAEDIRDEIAQQRDNFTSDMAKYQSGAQEVRDSYQNLANNLLAGHQNDSAYQYTSGTIDEYKEQIASQLQNDVAGLGQEEAQYLSELFVNGMMNADVAGAEELAKQAGREAAEESLRTNLGDKLSNLTDSDLSDLTGNTVDFSQFSNEQIDAINEALIQTVIDQVNNSSLSEEDKNTLMSNIDWSQPIGDILADISQAVNTGSLDSTNLGNPEDFMDDERNARLQAYDVDEDTVNTYRELQEQTSDLSSREDELTEKSNEAAEAARNAADAYGETSDEYKDAAKQADKAADTLEAYNDTQEDLVDMSIQSQKGMEALSESIEDNAKILREGDTDSLEYAEAMDDTRQAVADLINVSKDDISPQFVTDNLDLIEKAAYGDIDAIQQLRVAAANEILLEINKTGNLTPENLAYLQQKALELSAMTIEPYANLDDTQFISALNNMLASGQLTADQVQSYLNSIGYDPVITEEPGPEQPIMTIKGSSIDFDILGQRLGGITIPDMTIMGQASMPKIESIQSIGSGGYTPVSSRARGNRPSGGGGGGGGGKKGGGGGGGGGSAYKPQTKDPIKDELDRYERVDTELDSLSNTLEGIADEQDRLLGDDLAKNMSEQIALLKEQVYWQNEKLKIQKEEAAEYRNELASQYGITFNAEGFITNYAERYKALLANLNNLIAQYNATTTEAGQEALDKQIENAQESFDNFNDLIDQYDDLISNQIIESENQIEEFYDQIEDLRIEAFNRAVESVDNLKDLMETGIDFNAVFTGMDSDDPFRDALVALENLKTYWDVGKESMDDYYDDLIAKNMEAMKTADEEQKKWLQYQNQLLSYARTMYGQQTFEEGGTGLFDMEMANVNAVLEQMRQYNENGSSTIFGENAADLYETAQDIYDSATSMLEDYEGHLDDLKDAILDAIDEIGEAMDDRLDQYENINDELDHYASMIEMLQGDQAYDALNEANSAAVLNNQQIISELKQSITVLQDLQSAMEEGSDEWKAVQELIDDQQSELLDKTEDTMEKLVEIYENGVNNILDKWIGSTGMGDDLDWISEEWELINRNADYYLDDVNAAYEIQKLQGKYLELLDNSNDLAIQNQITEQMSQQLAYLREKDKLSEYDVAYANAQLEILQKRIALEDAQRNKSQLQLRRDTQGNYSYVYTADEGDIAAAEGEYLDAQNNAYNLSKEQMSQTQDDSLSALQDARDMLEQIWTNANLTLEEKTKRTQTIIDSLKEYLAGTSEQLSTSEINIINDFIGMCDILTDENDERLQDVYEQIIAGNNDAFDQIDTRWSTSITNWLQNMEDFNASTDSTFNDLIDNFGSYDESLGELGDLAEITFDDMSNSIQNAVDKTNDLASSTSDFINQLKSDAGTVKEYEQALADMTAKIQDAENGMKAYQEQVNKLQQDLVAKEQENANLSNQVANLQNQIDSMLHPNNGAGNNGANSTNGQGGAGSDELAWGIAQAIWTYGQASGWGNDPIRSGKLTKAYGHDFARKVQNIINQNYRSGSLVNYGSSKYSSYNLIGYDTGGYTGDNWDLSNATNDGGKIAVLHEKELVLNATDTANILAAVDAVRQLTTNFRNGAFENTVSMLNKYGSEILGQTARGDTIEQSVQIDATFPNVRGAEEVEQALLDLTNQAAQYAHKQY